MFKKSGLKKFIGEELDLEVEKVLILDGHNLIYRTAHVANYQAPEDIEFGYWKYLIVNSFLTTIKNFEPNKVIFAIDSGKSWRWKIYNEYKSHRKAARNKSTLDFEKFFKVSNQFMKDLATVFSNIYFLNVDLCEGDDIIAILSTKKFITSKVSIISTDKDMIQLLTNKNIQVYNPIKKRFIKCLNPRKELELKILTGDNSDNIPGIKSGVGLKTAEKLLNEGLDKLLTDKKLKKNYKRNKTLISFEDIPKNISKSIITHYENYKLEKYDGTKIWHFLIKNKITKLADNLGIYSPYIKHLS